MKLTKTFAERLIAGNKAMLDNYIQRWLAWLRSHCQGVGDE
jgi:hypothetical protein